LAKYPVEIKVPQLTETTVIRLVLSDEGHRDFEGRGNAI